MMIGDYSIDLPHGASVSTRDIAPLGASAGIRYYDVRKGDSTLILGLLKDRDPSELDDNFDALQQRIFTISNTEINGVKGRFYSYASVYGGTHSEWWMKKGPTMLMLSLNSRDSHSETLAELRNVVQTLVYRPEEKIA